MIDGGPARRAVAGAVGVVGADLAPVGEADLVGGRRGGDAEDPGRPRRASRAAGTRRGRRRAGPGPRRRTAPGPSASTAGPRRRRRWRCRAGPTVSGPMVEPQGWSLRPTNTWWGTPARSQASIRTAWVPAVGGVALVGVDLDDRAAVDRRPGGRARGARGSWGGWRGPCRPTRRPSRRRPGAGRRGRRRGPATARSSTWASRAPSAPVAEVEPTSSWSNRQTHRDGRRRRRRRGRRPARRAARRGRPSTSSRLSSRADETSSWRRPSRAPGVRSWTMRVPGDDGRRRRRRPRRPRTRRRRRPRPGPTPHTGVRCCCGLSLRPWPLTSRSRWMASCGMRRSGPSQAKSRSSSSPSTRTVDPARQAEVAVEPRVPEGAAVDLDGELLPPEPARVGLGLDPEVRAVGVGAHDPERAGPGRRPRAPPRRPGRRPGRRGSGPGPCGHGSSRSSARKPGVGEPAAASATAWYGDGAAPMKARRSCGVGHRRARLRRPIALEGRFGSSASVVQPAIRANGVPGAVPPLVLDARNSTPMSTRRRPPKGSTTLASSTTPAASPSWSTCTVAARHQLVEQGITALVHLDHRGASGAETNTGDGAGILIQVPDAFYRDVRRRRAARRPATTPPASPSCPATTPRSTAAVEAIDKIVASEGLEVLAWRDVPVVRRQPRLRRAGRHAHVPPGVHRRPRRRATRPRAGAPGLRGPQAHRARDRPTATAACTSRASRPAPSSTRACSPRPSCATSTRTCPTSGSRAPSPWCTPGSPPTRSRRGRWPTRTATWPTTARSTPSRATATGCAPARPCSTATCSPATSPACSRSAPPAPRDTASFDEVLELLHLGGRPLPHAVLMMIPEAWENHDHMDPARRAFYRFHASLMEPWDGPANVSFTDGTVIGAVLDRNGLRPGRFWVTTDGLVVLGSEAGVLDIPADQVVRKGRLQPGKMFLVDTAQGRIIEDDEVKATLAAELPYQAWLDQGIVELDRPARAPARALPARRRRPPPAHLRLHDRGPEDPHRPHGPHRRRGPRLDGHRHAHRRAVRAPAAAVRLLRPALRPGHQPAARRHPRGDGHQPRRHHRPRAEPAGPRPALVPPDPAAVPDPRQRPAGQADPRRRDASTTSAPWSSPGLYPVAGGGAALRRRARRRPPAGQRGHRRGRQRRRAVRPGLHPRAGADPVAAAHRGGPPPPGAGEDPHRGRPGGRGRRRPRGAPHGAPHRVRRRGHQPVPRLRDHRGHGRPAAPSADVGLDKAVKNYIKGAGKGVLKVMSKMGISTVASYTGAQVFEAVGLGQALIDEYFTGTTSKLGGIGLDELAPEVAAAPRQGLPGPPHRAGPPRARGRRRVPVAPGGGVPPLQPRDRVQAPARHAHQALRRVQGVHAPGSTSSPPAWPRCAACSPSTRRPARRSRSTRSSRSRRSSSASPPEP